QRHGVRRGLIAHPHRRRGGPRVFQRVGDHRRDDLPAVADLPRVEQGKLGVVDGTELRRIQAGQEREDARYLGRGADVDAGDNPVRDLRLDREDMGGLVRRGFGRIPGAPGDLVHSLDAVHGISSSSVAMIRFLARATLYTLRASGAAPRSSASAAAANESRVAWAPARVRSAMTARHGTCATPPSASAQPRTAPPGETSSSAATETSANANDARSRTFR